LTLTLVDNKETKQKGPYPFRRQEHRSAAPLGRLKNYDGRSKTPGWGHCTGCILTHRLRSFEDGGPAHLDGVTAVRCILTQRLRSLTGSLQSAAYSLIDSGQYLRPISEVAVAVAVVDGRWEVWTNRSRTGFRGHLPGRWPLRPGPATGSGCGGATGEEDR
jgi:hypothetical protein